MTRRSLTIILLAFLIVPWSSGLDYEVQEYTDDSVTVQAQISADTPWIAPFAEELNLTIKATPIANSVVEINITRITLIVNKAEADGSGYILISAETIQNDPLSTGQESAEFTTSIVMNGNNYGDNCYFALLVAGSYYNATTLHYFEAVSNDDLVGPFSISASIITPQVWVGIFVLLGAAVFFTSGMYACKKSRTPTKKRTLLED